MKKRGCLEEDWGSDFSGESCIGPGEGWKSHLLYTQAQWASLQRDHSESLFCFLQVAQWWPEVRGLAALVAEQGRCLRWGRLHPRVCWDQGWGLHSKIQMWASKKTEPARNHLDPAWESQLHGWGDPIWELLEVAHQGLEEECKGHPGIEGFSAWLWDLQGQDLQNGKF